MIEINGYRIKGTSIKNVETVLDEAGRRVCGARKEEYHRLLAGEITRIIDDIALNAIKRPEEAVFGVAVRSLAERITAAERLGLANDCNLLCGCICLTDGTDTYVVLRCQNPLITEAFAGTKGISEYILRRDALGELPPDSKRELKWKNLSEKYGDNLSATALSRSLVGPVDPDRSILSFGTPAERAGVRARHTLTRRYLGAFSGGDIKPELLTDAIDFALSELLTEEAEEEMRYMEVKLSRILPEITEELITGRPEAETAQGE
jgi:hypothetical protein